MAALVEHRPRRTTLELRTALVREAEALVRSELARPITLAEVAGRVATSRRQLQRAFADVRGTTFGSFVREVRMEHAAELLAATDMPAGEVGRRVGYREPSQFTKAFKRAYALTPSQFRAARRRGP